MKKNNSLFTAILIVFVIIVGGFIFIQSRGTAQPTSSTESQPIQDEKKETMKVGGYQGNVIAGKSTSYLEFNKQDYDKAISTQGHLIFLNFYANWCPICRAELLDIKSGFETLSTMWAGTHVVGFQVNYNDNETDEDEKKLAQELGVTYQHTKVIINGGQTVLGPIIEQWDKQKLINELAKFHQ